MVLVYSLLQANDIFFYRWGNPVNIYFSRLTKRYLFVRGWTELLFVANNWLPGGEQHKFLTFVLIRKTRDTDGLFSQVKTQLTFTDEENQLGHSFLELISSGNQKYVCLIVRDSSYLRWASYHNYRDIDMDTFSDTAMVMPEVV